MPTSLPDNLYQKKCIKKYIYIYIINIFKNIKTFNWINNVFIY